MADLNPPATAASRQPRWAVKLNGSIVTGGLSFEVENNNFQSADTFDITFAANALPTAFNPIWMATQDKMAVEIFATDSPTDPVRYAPTSADSLIYGNVDEVDFDPVAGTVKLNGRDLTALLIDSKTAENQQNQTSSEVATLFAGRVGLTPVVTATTTKIGQYYEIDHTDINQERSEWDFLVQLAKWENFDVFVKGKELHFQPKPTDSGGRYAILYTPPSDAGGPLSINAIALSFTRNLTIAKGVVVNVRSWNAKQKKGFSVSWPKAAKSIKPGQSTNNSLTYNYYLPGLTQDQAQLRAQRLYAEIMQHLVKLTADLPGDSILDCTKIMQVRGTGTAFDTSYYPDSVKRSMSQGEGYRMTVSAKSVSQDTEAGAS